MAGGALYDDMRLETPRAESFVNYSWDVRAMLDARRSEVGMPVLGLRSGGILRRLYLSQEQGSL